jgi:diguanylate cyclase (GGDEF)-like protein
MHSSDPLLSWLLANHRALHQSWSAAVGLQLDRMQKLPDQVGVFERAHELLVTLGELVKSTPPSSGSEDRSKTVLRDLKRLQSEEQLSTAEVVLLLFTIRDAVRATAEMQTPISTRSIRGEPPVDVDQLCRLLTRLGLVFLEVATGGPVDEVGPAADSNVEYALRYERARLMAITDSLTGLHNFGYFKDRLTEERRRAERYQRLLSLIIFDLDHFKSYNDTHGHPAGNEVLRQVATILQQEARETDLVARYGGEELVIVLPETNRKTGWEVAERIRSRVRDTPFTPPGKTAPERVTLSAGVATFPVDATHEDELIERADASLYAAKASGRDRVIAYEPPHKVTIAYRPDTWVENVALVGNFNNWDKDADPMTRRSDGAFEFVISLNPGSYRYKFVLNGSAWIPDPSNTHTQPDDMGGVNSVLCVTDRDAATLPVRA